MATFQTTIISHPSKSYADFQKSVAETSTSHKFSIKFDIASYFNSIYHHDLVRTISNLAFDESDVKLVGKFLRQINSGRSIGTPKSEIYRLMVPREKKNSENSQTWKF